MSVKRIGKCEFIGSEIEGFADAVQKAAGDLFPAIHVAPRTVIERGCGSSAVTG
jgi:hypothetical protein